MKMKNAAITAIALVALTLTGCSKGPNEEQLNALEEARGAAESAERAKAAKVQERTELEAQVAAKEGQLSTKEEERDDVKQKMEEHNAK